MKELTVHHQARKRFGQNFLNDSQIIAKIIQAINPKADDNLVEIGPGLGALTQPIIEQGFHLKAVELDKDLIPYLRALNEQEKGQLEIKEADALSVDFAQYGQNIRVFGNLPYNISTPLLFHLLNFKEQLLDMHFMLQKEVVDRISASPNSKAYGRLSVVIQYLCKVEPLFVVSKDAFRPKPKVESAIIRLTPYKANENPYQPVSTDALMKAVRFAFAMRRKTLRNNFKQLLNEAHFESIDISPSRRAETLTMNEFIKLAQLIEERYPRE